MEFLYDCLVEFVGAFLGFAFALFLAGMSNKYDDKKKNQMILNGIRNELEDINSSVKQYTEKKIALKHRIAIPTWDSLQYSGGIMGIMEHPCYDGVLTVYSSIRRYNEEYKDFTIEDANKELVMIEELIDGVLIQMPKEKRNVKNSKSK